MHMPKYMMFAGVAAVMLITGTAQQLSAQSAKDWPWEAPAGAVTDRPAGGAKADPQMAAPAEGEAPEMAAPPAAPAEGETPEMSGPPTAPMTEEAMGDEMNMAPAADWSIENTESDIAMIDDGLETPPEAVPELGGGMFVQDVPTAQGKAAAKKGRIDVSAYEDLLRENMQLRREVTSLQQGVQESLSDKQRLEVEIRDLERQVSESVALIQNLRQGGSGSGAPDAQQQAAQDLLIAERDQLASQLEALKVQLQNQPAATTAGVEPQPGSDLFRALEADNAALKQQLLESNNAKEAALAEVEALKGQQATRDGIQAELDGAQAKNAQLQMTIDKLLERVPAMEKDLAAVRDSSSVQQRNLEARDREVATLKLEMDRREQRLIKAERMNALMERTRAEIEQVSKKDQRDLHFNMAAVYAKEGRYPEAKQAYLQALRVDPTDAGTHYNLAILYEDVLRDRRKAAMHYRAYLKLAPNAEDADDVRGWLLQLEMN